MVMVSAEILCQRRKPADSTHAALFCDLSFFLFQCDAVESLLAFTLSITIHLLSIPQRHQEVKSNGSSSIFGSTPCFRICSSILWNSSRRAFSAASFARRRFSTAAAFFAGRSFRCRGRFTFHPSPRRHSRLS